MACTRFRTLVLGLTALAGLANCVVYDEVESITPLPDETGVDLDEIPTIRTTTELDLDRGDVSLIRAADDTEVAGTVDHHKDDEGYWLLRFDPKNDLDPDTDYRLSVIGLLDGYSYVDPITSGARYFGTNERIDIPFTTTSDPRVRHSTRYKAHAYVYLSFSQDMNPQTLNDQTIEVALDGTVEPPLEYTWESGPAHQLKIRMRRVDFEQVDVSFLEGVEAIDGTPMLPQTIEVESQR